MAQSKRKPASAKRPGTKRRGPITSGELHRWLTEPGSARALDEAVAARLEDARLATRGERAFPIGRLANDVAKLLDTATLHPHDPWTVSAVDVLRRIDLTNWFHAQFRTYYPRNHVPAVASHAFPFEQDPYRNEETLGAVGPAPGNPDHEASLFQGFATCNTETGVITTVAHDMNGRSILSAGPAIVFDSIGASFVDLSCQAFLDYVYRFEAQANPQFDPARTLGPQYQAFMQFAIEVRAYLTVKNKATGVGYGGTAGSGVSRPHGITMYPAGAPAGPGIVTGTYRNDSDVSVPVKFNSTFTVPANSQCTVELFCLTDTTSVGPRNGKWNTHVCYAESTTTLSIPSIDVSIFPA